MQNEKTIEELQQDILKNYDGPDRVVPSDEALKLLGSESDVDHFDLGIPKLDELMTGVCFGDLVVVSAATGQGKTSLCRTLTTHLTEHGLPCLWFSYEEPPRQFLRKFQQEQGLPIFYLPLQSMPKDMGWLEKRIDEGRLKYDARFIFIDHLHYLFDMGAASGNMSLELGALVRMLKSMAISKELVIFLIAHMSKPKEITQAPTMNYIRDSSFVTQEADFVITLKRNAKEHRDGTLEYFNTAMLYLEKNRRTGQLGSINLEMINGKFVQALNTLSGIPQSTPADIVQQFRNFNGEPL